jgi:tetratricopeptide (TPR) repeat protein
MGEPPERRWRVPPALRSDPGEALEGSAVLDEVPFLKGTLLWLMLRDAMLFAAVDPNCRAGLFAPRAFDRRKAFGSLPTAPAADEYDPFAAMLDQPLRVRPAEVALACSRVALWAESQRALRTAVAFRQAAALLLPDSAAAALAVAEAASRAGQHARAYSWAGRAIALGRRSGERDVYVAAYLFLGRALVDDGRPADARRAFMKAARGARRYGVTGAGGAAREGLFRIAGAEGRDDLAARLGAAALRTHPRRSREWNTFALEFARWWLVRGDAARAWRLVLAVTTPRNGAEPGPEAWALLARVAVAVGRRDRFDDAWARAWSLLRTAPEGSVPPAVEADLAAAATALAMLRDTHQPPAGDAP